MALHYSILILIFREHDTLQYSQKDPRLHILNLGHIPNYVPNCLHMTSRPAIFKYFHPVLGCNNVGIMYAAVMSS